TGGARAGAAQAQLAARITAGCVADPAYIRTMSVPDQVQSSRLQLSPGHPIGVTEEMISQLVRAFYDKARLDALLGPVFESNVEAGDEHFAKMDDFWSWVVLMSGRYHGTPMQAHARLAEIGPEHFARWLQLFIETAEKVCPSQAA